VGVRATRTPRLWQNRVAIWEREGMEIHKDDRVKMPTKPEWGLGQVIQEPAGGKVAILFREVGRKTLSLKHAKLENVEGDEASDPWLDHLDADSLGQDTRYLGPREAVAAFLEKYPEGFLGAAYQEEERAPKMAAHEALNELLGREVIDGLIAEGSFAEVGKRALRVIGKTNLVYPNDRAALSKAMKQPEHPETFAKALREHLYGEEAPDVRFKRFTDALQTFSAGRWTLVTYFPFVAFPEDYMILKPTVTQNAAAVCRFDLGYKAEPNRITYGRLLAFARVLRGVMADLKPADMFDLQAFMWCLAQLKK
jgi:hypothetical protein